MSRTEANERIMDRLEKYLIMHPEMRFVQALQNLNIIKREGFKIVDSFYEESEDTLATLCGG